jgi:hypothetical protein
MPRDASRVSTSFSPSSGWKNDGHPQPESNFASEEKSGSPQAAHL